MSKIPIRTTFFYGCVLGFMAIQTYQLELIKGSTDIEAQTTASQADYIIDRERIHQEVAAEKKAQQNYHPHKTDFVHAED